MTDRNELICITGGAGFIGGHLVRALLAQGYQVTVLDNLSVGHAENVPADARLVVGDIHDPQSLANALEGATHVVHLAARVAIRSSFEFVVEDTDVNVVGTASVLHALTEAKGVKRFVAASSMAVYSDADQPLPITEQHPAEPVSPYGISKLAAERLTHACCSHLGIDSVVLRLFNTYGPGQALSPYVGVVTIFVNKMMQGETPIIYGDGEQCRDFVHVSDVVQGFIKALFSEVSGETFNIGTSVATSVNQIVDYLNTTMGVTLCGRHVAGMPGELRYSIADISKAQKMLDYAPQHHLQNSIAVVVNEICTTTKAVDVS